MHLIELLILFQIQKISVCDEVLQFNSCRYEQVVRQLGLDQGHLFINSGGWQCLQVLYLHDRKLHQFLLSTHGLLLAQDGTFSFLIVFDSFSPVNLSILKCFLDQRLLVSVSEELFEAFLEILFTNIYLFKDFFDDGLQAFLILSLHQYHMKSVSLHIISLESFSPLGDVFLLLLGELDAIPDNGSSIDLEEGLEGQQVAHLLKFFG